MKKLLSRPLILVASGILVTAMNAVAATAPTVSATKPLQFTSGGHVVGFTSKDVVVATGSHALRVEFVGAQAVEPVAAGAAATGSAAPDSKAAPLTRVTYPGIWSGITLAYDAPSGLMRSTYTVAPGADPAQIRLRYNAPVAVEPGGGLRIAFARATMSESAPVAWQERDGRRVPVSVAFHKESEREVGFAVGAYDKARPLTIDPTLTWNTSLGGAGSDSGNGIAVDTSGNVYVTGSSTSTWGNPILPFVVGSSSSEAFVAKLDSSGALLWNTFLGGGGSYNDDCGYGIALDAGGNVYVSGTSDGSWGTPIRPGGGAFAAKLDAHGALLWNTFLGAIDYGNVTIAVDVSGNAYVTGLSYRTWGDPIRPYTSSNAAFVAKLDTNGALLWNTFLGGASVYSAYSTGIAVDTSGNVFVTGTSANTWGDPIRPYAYNDAFVAKLDTNGILLWNTFLGGTGCGIQTDISHGIAVDSSGNVFVSGNSPITWGTPVHPFEGYYGDAFVAKLDNNGALLWNTFIGEDQLVRGYGIAVDAIGNVYVSGFQNHADDDAFAAKYDTNGAQTWKTFMWGKKNTQGLGIAVDANRAVYVTGANFNDSSPYDSFVATIANDPPVVSDQWFPATVAAAKTITLLATDADGDSLTYAVATSPAHGTLSGTAPNLSYLSEAGYEGEDSFTFMVSDGIHSVTATGNIWVMVSNAPPITWDASLGVVSPGKIAVDSGGNYYVVGSAWETWGSPIRPFVGYSAASVAKYDANGVLLWNSFLGGGGSQTYGIDIAVDSSDNLYVAGIGIWNWGTPINPYSGSSPYWDGFVAKIDSDGVLLWNTFLGGTDTDYIYGIAVDAGGNTYVSGRSFGTWGNPVRPWTGGSEDALVAKLDSNGALLWNTFLGGDGDDRVYGIAIDASGNTYVSGRSTGTWGEPILPWMGGTADASVVKLDSNGALLWNTFLGGDGDDYGYGIAIDTSGKAYVSGRSTSTWGEPVREWMGGAADASVTKLDSNGALLWNTFLGGTADDYGYGIALDANGNAYVTGSSSGPWAAPSSTWAGFGEATVAKLTTDGVLMWHTFSGWSVSAYGCGIAIDTSGNGYFIGSTANPWGDPNRWMTEPDDAFVFKIENITDTPVASDQHLSTFEDTAVAITLSAMDSDGSALTFTVVIPPSYGTLSGSAPDLTYHPAGHFSGTDSFMFQAHDGSLDSNVARVSITVTEDTTAPTGSILINNGAASTSNATVTLNLTATDAGGSGLASMRFRNNTVEPYSAWEPYQATRSWTLVGGVGTVRVYAQFADNAGNLSDANPAAAGAQGCMDAIELTLPDTIPPTGTIQINSGAASTSAVAVTLNLSASDGGGSGVVSMRFRAGTAEPYSAWEPYKTTKSWTLTDGLGTKKVYVQFIDKAGNISDANPAATGAQGYVDAIELVDGIAPTGSIQINGGAASTGTTAVTLNLSAADTGGSGLASMHFRNNTTDPYSDWEPYAITKAWTLTSGAGSKKVYVQFKDTAGNISDANPAAAGAQAYSDGINCTGP